MKTRILALVMVMTFIAGVTTAQGALPKGYESVVLYGIHNQKQIATFNLIGADGQVDPSAFVVPNKKRLVITEFTAYSETTNTVVNLMLGDTPIIKVKKTEPLLNFNMTTGFAVAPGAVLQAYIEDLTGAWYILLRGYLMPWKH